MKAIDILLSLQNHGLELHKAPDGKIHAQYYQADVKDGCFLIGTYGEGVTFDEACEDYLNKIRGKRLVFNADSSNTEEVTVL